MEKAERKIYASIIKPDEAYQFSSKKLDYLLRFFYGISLGLIIHRFSYRVTAPYWLKYPFFNWSWSVKWLDCFEEQLFIVLAVFFLTFFLCMLCVFFVRSVWIKVSCAFSFFILSSIEFSLGNVGHYLHCWLFIFIIFSFVGNDRRKDKFFFHTAQFWFLMTYGLSGIHKLKALFYYISEFGLKDFKPIAKSIAVRLYDMPYYTTGKTLLLEVLSWPPVFSLFLWSLVIYFQISCFFVVFRPPLYRLWGIFIILFHLVTVFMLQVMFLYNMILTAFLLVETPYEIEFSLKKSFLNMPGVRFFLSLASYLFVFLKKTLNSVSLKN